MKLYLLSQSINDGYDTFDSCVVCAEDEQEARTIHPSKYVTHHRDGKWYGTYTQGGEYEIQNHGNLEWVSFPEINKIEVTYLGEAADGWKKGVVCASFNAG